MYAMEAPRHPFALFSMSRSAKTMVQPRRSADRIDGNDRSPERLYTLGRAPVTVLHDTGMNRGSLSSLSKSCHIPSNRCAGRIILATHPLDLAPSTMQ